MTPSTAPESRAGGLWPRHPSWGGAIGLFVVAAGWIIGLRPLSDNSFLTHLATGRLILDRGSVPTTDPYTFTASGEPWVVQSWLVSIAYASAERLGGLDGVRVLVAVLAATLAGLAWTLLRPAQGIVIRLVLAALFLTVGAGLWAERPFMVGLICLALVCLAMEGRLDPRWLVPIGWVWVNSHGSFPLGIVAVAVAAAGQRLDRAPATRELACLRWLVPGVLLGMVGPLGFRVLVFPVQLLTRQDVLSQVIEWRAPTFDTTSQRVFVLQLVLAIVGVARRPSYRAALIVGVFTATALLGARNLPVASLVMLPVMAASLSGVGSLSSADRDRTARLAGAGAIAVLVVLTFARLQQEPLNLGRYPIAALAHLEEVGVDTREVHMAAPDYVGNLTNYIYGPEGRTFYDDRFDMFPDDVSAVQQALNTGGSTLRPGLDRLEVHLVTVLSASASAQILVTDPSWRVVFLDDEWTLLCRRGTELGGDTC